MIENYAIMLWCKDHAFKRWLEATPVERNKYREKAQMLYYHMQRYEGVDHVK